MWSSWEGVCQMGSKTDQPETCAPRKLLRANQAYLIFFGAMVNGVTSRSEENEVRTGAARHGRTRPRYSTLNLWVHALVWPSAALVHERHRLRSRHIAGFHPFNPEAGTFDHRADGSIEMTAATDALPGRCQPVLPSPHIPVRRHAVLHEQELAARPKHATHFGERYGGIWNAAQGPGRHNGINAAIIEWNGFC